MNAADDLTCAEGKKPGKPNRLSRCSKLILVLDLHKFIKLRERD